MCYQIRIWYVQCFKTSLYHDDNDIYIVQTNEYIILVIMCQMICTHHGPLARYAKLRVAHAPGMPGTFSPSPRFSDPDMHHGTCVTHVPWCMSGSLTSGFLWSRWWGKCSRHSQPMHNPQFYVSGKMPIDCTVVMETKVRFPGICMKKLTINRISWYNQLRLTTTHKGWYQCWFSRFDGDYRMS